MKREPVLRNLHMGCGERLVGRIQRMPANGARVPVVQQTRLAGQPAGKGKR